MAWSAGPGELYSIEFNSNEVLANLVEGLSVSSEPDAYDSAAGFSVERGSLKKVVSCTILDVSVFSALAALMEGRTEHTVRLNYIDATGSSKYQDIAGCILRITPVVSSTTDALRCRIASDGTANTSLASNFTDLGPILGSPTYSFAFPFDGTDGEGRPYFSTVRTEVEFTLPGTSSIDPTALLTSGSHRGVKNQVAIDLPDGNFVVFTDAYAYYHYADEDASTPRSTRLRIVGTATSWGALLGFTDGTATPTDEDYDAASPTLAADFFHGMQVEATGFHYTESSLTTFS